MTSWLVVVSSWIALGVLAWGVFAALGLRFERRTTHVGEPMPWWRDRASRLPGSQVSTSRNRQVVRRARLN